MTPMRVWRCADCGRRIFPFRELCPYCSGRAFVEDTVDRGVATELTSHRGVRIASVRVDDDLVLLARAALGVASGSSVELRQEGSAPVALLADGVAQLPARMGAR